MNLEAAVEIELYDIVDFACFDDVYDIVDSACFDDGQGETLKG